MNKTSYADLAAFGKKLLDSTALEKGLPLIAEYSSSILNAERCSIFVYDKKTGELWTTLSEGIERIIIDEKKGIVGRAIQTRSLIIENDVENNPYFLEEIDKESGFQTKNIIVTPIFNEDRRIVGALELLNKTNGFNNDDAEFMIFFANFISSFIDLAPR